MWQLSAAGLFATLALTISPWLALPAAGMLLLAVQAFTADVDGGDDAEGE